MRSSATLTIIWTKPEIGLEEWEFIAHPAKQSFYRRHGITWKHILDAFDGSTLTPWPRGGEISGIPVAGSYHTYDDYICYLARSKRGYRRNYTLMEEALQRTGELVLPAPIILACNGEGLLFAGWRRLCLAWNYGMIPGVWLVQLAGGGLS